MNGWAKAAAKLDAGTSTAPSTKLKVALAINPQLDAARVMLADIAMRDNRIDEAKTYLEACSPVTRMEEEFQRVATKIVAAEEPVIHRKPALKARIESDGSDHDARFHLAAVYAAQNQFEPAFQTLPNRCSWIAHGTSKRKKRMVEYFASPTAARTGPPVSAALAATLNYPQQLLLEPAPAKGVDGRKSSKVNFQCFFTSTPCPGRGVQQSQSVGVNAPRLASFHCTITA